MSTYEEIELKTKLIVDADLEVDQHGVLNVVVLLDTDDSRDPDEVRISFEDVVMGLIEFHKDDITSEGIRQMYCMAHELDRMSEKLYEVASTMEDARMEQD
jgi:hypothetical protein